MKDTYEDYVKPPPYADNQESNDPLITKLRLRIQQDLNQIHGVYDSQILDIDEKKNKLLLQLELKYKDDIASINKNRTDDVSFYNEKAIKHIDNLITTMHNSPQKNELSWWEKLFG
jgi:hypothetical protein